MKLQIIIDTENEAFHPIPDLEIARILKELAKDFTKGDCRILRNLEWSRPLYDMNGNKVGLAHYE